MASRSSWHSGEDKHAPSQGSRAGRTAPLPVVATQVPYFCCMACLSSFLPGRLTASGPPCCPGRVAVHPQASGAVHGSPEQPQGLPVWSSRGRGRGRPRRGTVSLAEADGGCAAGEVSNDRLFCPPTWQPCNSSPREGAAAQLHRLFGRRCCLSGFWREGAARQPGRSDGKGRVILCKTHSQEGLQLGWSKRLLPPASLAGMETHTPDSGNGGGHSRGWLQKGNALWP